LKAILIDSDILIEVSRARDAGILDKWSALSGAGALLLCSLVTVAEIWTRRSADGPATTSVCTRRAVVWNSATL
jgi:predicted nucleic acid-binding protein